jgi:hypothetical protein
MRLEQALAKRSKADAALADLMTKLHGLDVEADDYASTCMLPERAKIVAEIETATKAIPALFQKLEQWRAKFIRQYPTADLELPYEHWISTDRVHRNVLAAFRTIRAEDVHDTIDGLADAERKQHVDLINDLKRSGVAEEDQAA